jgi:hypothetical protein
MTPVPNGLAREDPRPPRVARSISSLARETCRVDARSED